MDTTNIATDVQIQNPQAWALALRINEDSLIFAAHSNAEPGSLINRALQLARSEDNYLRSLENCIYDNPLLLLDFKSITISFSSRHFVIVPDALSDAQASDAFTALFGNVTGDVVIDPMPRCAAKIAFELPTGVLRFINRTFESASIHHHLRAVCEHFAAKSQGASVCRQFVYLHDGSADVCIFNHDKFAFANSFACPSPADAAFFVLNAWNQFGLSPSSDELQLIGDRNVRDAIAPMLRNYVTYVMPAIFPAASMRMGHDAVKTPFDLILLLLCE
ncbi:MAG: DUF3822 family protein [Muribaculaceae bacterium]